MVQFLFQSNCDKKIAERANVYLCNYLMFLPRKGKEILYNYRETIFDKSGRFDDISSVYFHLVESCFDHYSNIGNITTCSNDLVQYPNCEILISFFTKMLRQFLSVENDFFIDAENQVVILLKWINKFHKLTNRTIFVLPSLHDILMDKVKLDSLNDPSLTKFEFIVNAILSECSDILSTAEGMQRFFAISKSSLPLLELKIYQHKVYELIYKEKLPIKAHSSLTLRTIVYNYLSVSSSEAMGHQNTHRSLKSVDSSANRNVKKKFFKKKTKGDSTLHELCRNDLIGDLIECIYTKGNNLKPNVRNSAGYTPLHVACLANHYVCAKVLLEDIKPEDEPADMTATDNNGLTPLHCAAHADAEDIIRVILKYGGNRLLKLEDNFGLKPKEYAKSKELRKLLEDFEANDQTCDRSNVCETSDQTSTIDQLFSDLNIDDLTVPSLKDKEEYYILIRGIVGILNNYLDAFNLYPIKDGVKKLSHKDCECTHYVSSTSNTICDEDALFFKNLPQVLKHFIDFVEKDLKNSGLDIQKILLPVVFLKMLLSGEF